jgi:Uma2 family endonuclease
MEQTRIAPVTYRELLRYPDDLLRRELIDGEVVVSPAPSPTHQDVVANVLFIARSFARLHKLGHVWPAPLDISFSTIDVAQPDVVFLSQARRHLVSNRGIEGAPDLCVEAISKGTSYNDGVKKRALYARFGVLEYWIIDPRQRTIELLGLVQQSGRGRRSQRAFAPIRASAVLPGIALDTAEVFRPAFQ